MKQILLIAVFLSSSATAKNLSPIVKQVLDGKFSAQAIKTSRTFTWAEGIPVTALGCSSTTVYFSPSKLQKKFQCFDPKFQPSDYAGTDKLSKLNKKGIVTTYLIEAGPFKGMSLRWADPSISGMVEIQDANYRY